MLSNSWRIFIFAVLIFSLSLINTQAVGFSTIKPKPKIHKAKIKPAKDKTPNNKEKATNFSLKDQYGKELSYNFPKEKVSILAFADKKGAEQLEAWIRPLYEKYTDRIDIHGVAELSIVPAIARGIVRGIMKKDVKYSVLLDWEGKVSKSYKYQKKQANIFIIDKNGFIVHKEIGAADEPRLAKLFQTIDGLLAE
jgi:peroxiredoxin